MKVLPIGIVTARRQEVSDLVEVTFDGPGDAVAAGIGMVLSLATAAFVYTVGVMIIGMAMHTPTVGKRQALIEEAS